MISDNERQITFFFTDGSKLGFAFPKQGGADPATLMATVRKAMDSDKLSFEIDGDLLVIPMRNVQYVQVTPAPESLPPGVLKGARVIS